MAQKRKYLMFISYIGSPFRGSQFQCMNGVILETVTSAVESGLKFVFQSKDERPIQVRLASRTDKGVHALRAALTVSLPVFKYDFIKPLTLQNQLNAYFAESKNISVLEVYTVPDSFLFKEAIKSKTYLYRLGILKEEYLQFYSRRVIVPIAETNRTYITSFSRKFNLNRAQEVAPIFEGIKDYGAVLGKPSKNFRSTICNIMSFKVQESQPLFPVDPLCERFYFYEFLCQGNRFLFHMVRRMVALAIGAGLGEITLDDIQKLFDEPKPSSWPVKGVHHVPGFGLYLLDTSIDLEDIIQTKELVEADEESRSESLL